MIDEKGSVLYVGKARNLKARVQSYVRSGGHTNRIATMVSLTAGMEFVTTETEVEALLLEANLIKRLKPRYNVILRDDKSFPYILIGHEHRVAQLGKHRGARAGKGSYYGPFASAGAVNRTINALQKAFLLRSCSDSVYENRTRPCLLHQIKRCSAPCTGEIALEDYDELVRSAEAFLSGRSQTIKTELARPWTRRPSARFRAGGALPRPHRRAEPRHRPAGHQSAELQRGRRLRGVAGRRHHLHPGVLFPRRAELGQPGLFPARRQSVSESEVLAAFLAQFYEDKPAPRLVLLSHRSRSASSSPMRCRCAPGGGSRSPCRSAAKSMAWSAMR
jgi:excinuclease ABC subunit C